MASNRIQLAPNYQVVLDRFVTVCQKDERVVAAFLSGSYATNTADLYSELRAGLDLVRFYRQIAPPLAHAYHLPYPERLSQLMSARLAKLSGTLYTKSG